MPGECELDFLKARLPAYSLQVLAEQGGDMGGITLIHKRDKVTAECQ